MIHKQFLPSTTNKHKVKILFLLFLLFCSFIILFIIKYHSNYSKLNLIDFSSKIMNSTEEKPIVLYESSTTICLLSNYSDESLNIILFHKQLPIREFENCITYNANAFPLLSSNSQWYILNSEGEKLSEGDLIFNEICSNQCKWVSQNKLKDYFSPKVLIELIKFDKADVSYEADFESLFQYNYHVK